MKIENYNTYSYCMRRHLFQPLLVMAFNAHRACAVPCHRERGLNSNGTGTAASQQQWEYRSSCARQSTTHRSTTAVFISVLPLLIVVYLYTECAGQYGRATRDETMGQMFASHRLLLTWSTRFCFRWVWVTGGIYTIYIQRIRPV